MPLRGAGQPKQRNCAICNAEIARPAVPTKSDPRKYCSRACRQEAIRRIEARHYARNRDRIMAETVAWQAAHPGAVAEARRQRRADRPEEVARLARGQRLRRKYGIDHDDFERMVEEQGGVCAICRQPEARRSRERTGEQQPLSVDHDHSTGEVRGLLCARCNSVLGWIESPGQLDAALAYLRSARERQGKVA